MATTPNKGYEVQVTGSNSGLWGDILNDDVIEIIDNNLGGIVTKSVAGSNITLTSDESENVIIRLTGAQSADIQLTNPCIGFYFVENLTTNSFNITVTNGVSGVVVPKGRSTVIADETNGCRIAATDSFPTGTSVSFPQTAAPTGWTKSTAHNNKAIRLVSGTASSGGTLTFDTVFASQSVTGTVGATALTIAQMPLHGHPAMYGPENNGEIDTTGGLAVSRQNLTTRAAWTGDPDDAIGRQIGGTGGGQTHTHSFTGNAINLDVQYVDFIIAVKN